ncbi:MAG: hypothetical protein IPG97_16820 [Microthrixaceae bacterium]|nr:hypothetical protein [Microthrixaceae bacterium]
MFGGLVLQSYSAAPTGTSADDLENRAIYAAAQASSSLSESLSAQVRMDLVATLWVGDRVRVEVDDGPSQIAATWRVAGKTVDPAAAAFRIELSPWMGA